MGCQDLFSENDIFAPHCSDALSALGRETSRRRCTLPGLVPPQRELTDTVAARSADVSEKWRNDKTDVLKLLCSRVKDQTSVIVKRR